MSTSWPIKTGTIPAAAVRNLTQTTTIDDLLYEIISESKSFARPEISSYKVGAAGLGRSGAIYLGANCEFEGLPLNQTVHAEQAVIANAARHREEAIIKLAVSAAPCGHCRQFLFELNNAEELEILIKGKAPVKLVHFLPEAFGPNDLNIDAGMLKLRPPPKFIEKCHQQQISDLYSVASRAIEQSYAPYTAAYAAVALKTQRDEFYSGAYLENAAYNPSLSPIQSACSALFMSGENISNITDILTLQIDGALIDHAAVTSFVLQNQRSSIKFQAYQVTES